MNPYDLKDRAEDILSRVRYKTGWQFVIDVRGYECFLRCAFDARNVLDGEPGVLFSRGYLLSHHMTVSEIVGTAFKAALTAEEHEAREHFTYRGQRVFGPHMDVEQLASLMAAGGFEDARKPPPK